MSKGGYNHAVVRLAILVGPNSRGSNMESIALACSRGALHAEVAVVVAPREGCPAAQRAGELGLDTIALDPTHTGYADALLNLFEEERVDAVCLAGFLRLLPIRVVRVYAGRIVNIHPALLPRHGGKGMFGRHVHEAVLAAGDQESGCTVHFVTEAYDEGAILLQCTCPVEPDDTPESLAERVHKLERKAYPEALRKLLDHRFAKV